MQQDQQILLSDNKIRQQSTSAERKSHVESWKKSGLSMSEFCRQNKIAISSLSNWAQKLKPAKKTFKPLVVSAPPLKSNDIGVIEVAYQNGVKIRFLNPTSLSLIVRFTKELAGCN